MSIKIKRYLQDQYPSQASIFETVRTIPRLRRRPISLPEAVVRVTVGQMLSSRAAETIYGRVTTMASTRGLRSTHLLDFESLKSCGLSTNKARTICDFAKNVGPDSRAVDFWYDLEPRQLIETVKQHRGLGDWTAGIIALFYVGHEDVFPAGDGSLKRAISIINDQMPRKKRQVFDPENAKPYRSYLALYLWRALDSGLLVNGTAT